ncbi:MAG: peptide-methionine (S)-S-oxide reductase, partial [Gemmatimonadetes bacterium]|nr:peptide-methionine (S)-S-oxide reductase [Gemmatimonadota bacterium]
MRMRLLSLLALLAAAGSGAVHAQARPAARDTAVFAGGCFWCVEEAFDAVAGVVATTS